MRRISGGTTAWPVSYARLVDNCVHLCVSAITLLETMSRRQNPGPEHGGFRETVRSAPNPAPEISFSWILVDWNRIEQISQEL